MYLHICAMNEQINYSHCVANAMQISRVFNGEKWKKKKYSKIKGKNKINKIETLARMEFFIHILFIMISVA